MGAPESVVGGGGEESLSISRLLRNSCATSAHSTYSKLSSLYTLLHSVIYNSVTRTKKNLKTQALAENLVLNAPNLN